MRRAHYEYGFLQADNGEVLGLSFGYDHCGQHEFGIRTILSQFGVQLPEFPLGVEDRLVTLVPENLTLTHFKYQPADKRRKAYPAAALALNRPWRLQDKGAEALTEENRQLFFGEPQDKNYEPRSDLASAWDSNEFFFQVRGADNIARLTEVFEAFQRKDIAVAVPWAQSFFRGGLSFVIASRMPDDAKEAVLGQDLADKELHEAALATGIHKILEAAGRKSSALAPAWFDGHKDEIIFFLNPYDQKRYQHGWFTVEELESWARDEGPVMRYEELHAFVNRPEHRDWSIRLLRGMNAQGISPRHHEHLVWMDEARSIPGLRYRATRATEHLLPSGDYAFAELMARFAEPQPVAA